MADRAGVEERYTELEIQRYEAIYGRNFVSPGGLDSAREILDLVPLGPASRVLDVGCGIGGSAFHIARTFGSHVDGMDLSSQMIRLAEERSREEGVADRVRFFQADCLKVPYPRESYDLVYSRDTFLHIGDRKRLFETLRKHLAREGNLLFTDYARGNVAPDDEFAAYIAEHGYQLFDRETYARQLEATGFQVIRAEDRTDRFIEYHLQELERLARAGLAASDVEYLEARWRRKIDRARRGMQAWVLFHARA